ncbi:MAG: hypothetical protein PHY23_10245 [Oscillospiraceae bacterium]|nr:hypothetical protein [Oscillospiraceae bacterium]MDD4511268.1 hypothetical protein [Oscillospiraceae bacterium]
MKKGAAFTLTVIGFVLIVAGLCFLKTAGDASGVMRVLPYFMIGIGCGAFGHGMGEMISNRAMKKSPDIQREMEIAKNDERNIEISNRAKGKAYDAMIYIFGALMVSLGLMQIDTFVLLLIVFAYLVVVGISIYYRMKYDKEM